jgi:hypothetical protein
VANECIVYQKPSQPRKGVFAKNFSGAQQPENQADYNAEKLDWDNSEYGKYAHYVLQ